MGRIPSSGSAPALGATLGVLATVGIGLGLLAVVRLSRGMSGSGADHCRSGSNYC